MSPPWVSGAVALAFPRRSRRGCGKTREFRRSSPNVPISVRLFGRAARPDRLSRPRPLGGGPRRLGAVHHAAARSEARRADGRHRALRGAARPCAEGPGRRSDPARLQHHVPRAAAVPDGDVPARGARRRAAAAADRRRPGGRAGRDRSVDPDAVGGADGARLEREARRQGRGAGAGLGGAGINVDLAPAADVPVSRLSFMYQQGRTWSFDAGRTTRLAGAFAAGLGDAGTLAAMKHFPGIGLATRNTDEAVVHITATRRQLAPGLAPYRRARVPLVMLSNAVYDAYDRRHGAGWSPAIATTLLRGTLGFRGVSITDSLDGAAHARGIPTNPLAVQAAAGGTDLILVTGSEAASESVFTSLRRAAADGTLDLARLRVSYRRILALKRGL